MSFQRPETTVDLSNRSASNILARPLGPVLSISISRWSPDSIVPTEWHSFPLFPPQRGIVIASKQPKWPALVKSPDEISAECLKTKRVTTLVTTGLPRNFFKGSPLPLPTLSFLCRERDSAWMIFWKAWIREGAVTSFASRHWGVGLNDVYAGKPEGRARMWTNQAARTRTFTCWNFHRGTPRDERVGVNGLTAARGK